MVYLVEILKTYQILVAGIIGFTGVICTMLANAHIQRSHHNRDLMHQRQALRSALKAELCITKETFENRIKQTKDYDNKQHALLQNKVQTSVYDALLSSIGILETEEIKHIVEAYLLVYEIPYRIRLLAGTNAIGGFENEYIRLRPEHIAQVNRIHEALLPKIELAIKSIESHCCPVNFHISFI